MKITTIPGYVAISFLALSAALSAQEQVEQRQSAPMTAQPEGGFSKSIAGKWDCGEFGTMVLKDKAGVVTGTYSYQKGSVSGNVKDGHFTGTWKQAKPKSSGGFDFAISIERMTPKPTNLRGKWKYSKDKDWQETPWECTK